MRKLVVAKIKSFFEGSFASTNAYVEWLMYKLTLDTIDSASKSAGWTWP